MDPTIFKTFLRILSNRLQQVLFPLLTKNRGSERLTDSLKVLEPYYGDAGAGIVSPFPPSPWLASICSVLSLRPSSPTLEMETCSGSEKALSYQGGHTNSFSTSQRSTVHSGAFSVFPELEMEGSSVEKC